MWCQPVLPSAGTDLDVADVDVGGPFADGLLEVEGGKVSNEKTAPGCLGMKSYPVMWELFRISF